IYPGYKIAVSMPRLPGGVSMSVKLPFPRTRNQSTWRRLRTLIEAKYPKGRFVAVGDERVMADAATFSELESLHRDLGRKPGDSLIVQVGAEPPDFVTIFV